MTMRTWPRSPRSSTPSPRTTRSPSTRLHWADATYPGTVRFLAALDERPIGVATVGRIYVQPPEFDALWATVSVLAGARHRGIGTRSAGGGLDARSGGRQGLAPHPDQRRRPEGVEFLAHRGFAEYERAKLVRLDLPVVRHRRSTRRPAFG